VKRRAVLVLGFGALLALTASAPEPWAIERNASSIEMSVRALGGSRTGRFEDWRGDIAFDPTATERTRATVVVQAASLRLSPSAASRRAVGPGFLDSARHPVIRFELRSLQPLGGDRYTARANMTMKGRTRPVAFPVDLRVTGDRAHLSGAFTVDRADYGIGTSGPWNRLVARQVTVRVALQARRA
jgi:polyisoprenoid-binding protein YceI